MTFKRLKRLAKHLCIWPGTVSKYFPKASLHRIELAIAASETKHLGEICFVVEENLHGVDVLRNVSAKKRAVEVFSQFHVWDTAQNNGVLIYLLLADHDFEILADRGIHHHVGDAGWSEICQQMEAFFRQGQFEAGVLFGITEISQQLATHYPSERNNTGDNTNENANELKNAPIII